MSDQNEAPKSKLKLSSLSRKEDSGQPEKAEEAPITASVDRAEPAAKKPRLAFSPKAKPSAEATPSSSPTAPAPAPIPATPEQPAEITPKESTPAAPIPVAPAAPTPETETPAPARRIAIKRKVDATPEAPAAETPAAPTSTPAVAEEKPKLGLKAKIKAEGASCDAASTQSDATTDAPNPKFGLKPKPTESTPAAATPPPLKPQPKASTEVQKLATAATKDQPTPPELTASKDTLDSTGTEAPTSSRSNVVTSVIIILVLFCILAAAAGGIWFVLKDMGEPQVTESSAAVTPPPATEPESNTGGFNLAAPINQAKESIAKVPVMDLEVIEDDKETSPPSEPIIVRPQPASAPVPVSSEATAAAATSYKEAVSSFLANAYIGGVRNGANAKVIIDGRSHTIGSVVDPETGLTFLGTRDGRLVFRDGNSVVYVKSF